MVSIDLSSCYSPLTNVLDSDSECLVDTSDSQLRFKAIPSVGGNFNAGAARVGDNDKPLINTVFAVSSF
jgi:hypothetical protein